MRYDDRGMSAGSTGMVSRAIALHDKAVDGDPEAAREAYRLLRRVLQARPDDHRLEAYYGSTVALLGRDADDTQERFAKAMAGTRILDRAVAASPSDPQIRTLRAYVCLNLPETYFHRTSVAIEDFNYLIKLYDRNKRAMSRERYLDALFHLGKAYMNVGDEDRAQETWQRLIAERPEGRILRMLRSEGVVSDPFEHSERFMGLLTKGAALHDAAEAGDLEAAHEAAALFKHAVESHPGNSLLKAYTASCNSILSRYSTSSGDMFSGAINAIHELDAIVKRDPENPALRMVRAQHSYRLPEPFFHRTTTAIADYEFLIDQHENKEIDLGAEWYAESLFRLGDCHDRLGMKTDAARVWRKLLTRCPVSDRKTEVEHRLTSQVERGPSHAATIPRDETSLVAEGLRLIKLAVAGNSQAAEQAHTLFAQAHKQNPDNARIEALYGSSIGLADRNADDPSVIFGSAVQALLHANRAVEHSPDDVLTHLLRGYLCYSLPEALFHLTTTAIADLQFVCDYMQRSGQYRHDHVHAFLMNELPGVQNALAKCHERMGENEEVE